MNIINSGKRIVSFFYNRRKELLSKYFWLTVFRVVKTRFNFWERVGEKEFQHNLAVLKSRPWNLHVEVTNLCNSNCIFCAYQYQSRPHGFISDQLFQKALDEYCLIGGGDLMFEVVVGDPLVDKRLIQMIKMARQRKEISRIETITNLLALKDNQAKEFLESGISKITISTGPLREDLYTKIYRNNSYKKVLRNIQILLEENKKLGCPVEIKIAFRSNLPMKDTLQLPDYQMIANLPHTVEFNTDFDTWTGEIKQDQLLTGMHLRPISKLDKEPCIWFYDGPIVFQTGDVGLCGCRDYNANSELIVGNLKTDSLLNIWQSPKVEALRNRFYKGDFPEICKKCTVYANLNLLRSKPGSQRSKLTENRFYSAKKENHD